jgi:hypothetical protein
MNPFLMQPIHGLPIEAFPGPINVMKPKVQQSQNGSVDLVAVRRHQCGLANACVSAAAAHDLTGRRRLQTLVSTLVIRQLYRWRTDLRTP